MKNNRFFYFFPGLIFAASYAAPVPPAEQTEENEIETSPRMVEIKTETLDSTSVFDAPGSGVPALSSESPARDSVSLVNQGEGGKDSAAVTVSDSGRYEKPGPYIGLGAGWTLGSMPYLSEWNSMISDTPSISFIHNIWGDTADYSYSKIEDPSTYNAAFPLVFMFTPLIRDSFNLSTFISFTWMKKEYKGKIESEEINLKWENYRKVVFTDLSCGVNFHRLIPSRYLIISGADNISLNAGLGIAPLVLVSNENRESSNLLVKDYREKKIYNAFGFGWETGISTFRELKKNNIIEAGISYSGKWYGLFNGGGLILKWKTLNSGYRYPNELLSFTMHRFKLFFKVHFTRKVFDIQEVKEKKNPLFPEGIPDINQQ